MTKRVTAITLVLENCLSVTFKIESVFFALSNITEKVHGWGAHMSYRKEAKEMLMKIQPEANTIKAFSDMRLAEGITPFDRLRQFNDIVAVHIYYDDDSEDYVYLDWGGDADEINEYQSTGLHTKTGELCIVVSKNNKVHKQFYIDSAGGEVI